MSMRHLILSACRAWIWNLPSAFRRFELQLTLVLLCVMVVPQSHAQDETQGGDLGLALSRGCSITAGTVLKVGEPKYAAGVPSNQSPVWRDISFRVDSLLYGEQPAAGQRIGLTNVTAPAIGKFGMGPWSVWSDVQASVGGKWVVVLWGEKAQRPTWNGEPSQIALVLDQTRFLALVRHSIDLWNQLAQSPPTPPGFLRLIDENPQPFQEGLMVAFLNEKEFLAEPELSARMAVAVLSKPVLVPRLRSEVAGAIVQNFYRLSNTARSDVTEALTVAAGSGDKRVYEHSLATLIRLGNAKLLDMKPFLTPERRSSVSSNYQELVPAGQRGQAHEFEIQLNSGGTK